MTGRAPTTSKRCVTNPRAAPRHNPSANRAQRKQLTARLDAFVGMTFSNLVMFAVIVATAETLHAHHITNIEGAAQVAEAPKPVRRRDPRHIARAHGAVQRVARAVPLEPTNHQRRAWRPSPRRQRRGGHSTGGTAGVVQPLPPAGRITLSIMSNRPERGQTPSPFTPVWRSLDDPGRGVSRKRPSGRGVVAGVAH